MAEQKATRAKTGRGPLSDTERTQILALWSKRDRNNGTVSRIAQQFGVSHVTVSNIILKATGRRPSVHPCPRLSD